jgi:hypothetical protein
MEMKQTKSRLKVIICSVLNPPPFEKAETKEGRHCSCNPAFDFSIFFTGTSGNIEPWLTRNPAGSLAAVSDFKRNYSEFPDKFRWKSKSVITCRTLDRTGQKNKWVLRE